MASNFDPRVLSTSTTLNNPVPILGWDILTKVNVGLGQRKAAIGYQRE